MSEYLQTFEQFRQAMLDNIVKTFNIPGDIIEGRVVKCTIEPTPVLNADSPRYPVPIVHPFANGLAELCHGQEPIRLNTESIYARTTPASRPGWALSNIPKGLPFKS
jgi:hypothetical protein